MRTLIHAAFKKFFRSQLLQARGDKLTQEKMADILHMSVRAYAALEGGDTCCNLDTFLLYLLFCCPDRSSFVTQLLDALNQAVRDTA